MDHSKRFSVRSKAAASIDDEIRRTDTRLPPDNPLDASGRKSVWDSHRSPNSCSRRVSSSRSVALHQEKERNRQLIHESLNKSLSLIEGDTEPITPPQRTRSSEGPSLEEHFHKDMPQRRGSGSSVRSGSSKLSSRKRVKRRLKKARSTGSIDSGDLASVDSTSLDSASIDSASYSMGSISMGSASIGSVSSDNKKKPRKGRKKRKGKKDEQDSSISPEGKSKETKTKKKENVAKIVAEIAAEEDPKSRGDRAPVTPSRGPPSPRLSDASSPEADKEIAIAIEAPLVTREGESPIRLSRSMSEARGSPRRSINSPIRALAQSTAKAGEVMISPEQLEKAGVSSQVDGVVDRSRSIPFPPFQDFQSKEKANRRRSPVSKAKKTSRTAASTPSTGKVKEGTRKKFVSLSKALPKALPRLTKTLPFGTSKKKAPSYSSGKNSAKEQDPPSTKLLKNIAQTNQTSEDDLNLTIHSGTEQTVSTASTVSTTQSDLSTLSSTSQDQIQTLATQRTRRLTTIRTFSRLLARLRTDFDQSNHGEEDATERTDDTFEPEEIPEEKVEVEAGDITCRGVDVLNRLDGAATKLMPSIEEDEDFELPSDRVLKPSSQFALLPPPREESPAIRHRRLQGGVKSVGFGTVNIREYERTVGDNPAVSSGSPISLGWAYNEVVKVDVDTYEMLVRKQGPRTRRDFFLTPQMRFRLLLDDWGYGVKEIAVAKEQASEIRYQRQVSIFGDPAKQRRGEASSAALPLSSVNGSNTSSSSRKNIKGASYSNSKNRSGKLPKMPKADSRWDSSCPAAPTNKR